ncbi:MULTISPECIES: type VII secretion target [unclassified Mycolicibacterium]|uniref:type VII secretion target n=1 Tax=unclassified Mycolicibacterium TaxID=2636767 RepID=UPI002ED88EA2
MANNLEVDTTDLQQLAGAHDTAATTLVGSPAPSLTGSPLWATTSAVKTGHSLVTAAATTLANRSRATGAKVRTASGSYASTDEDSAEQVAEVGQTMQV